MAQNYRNQNEPGRWQEPQRPNFRSGGRDRYETGNERRYSPDWDERFYESSNDDSSMGFEGDRSYAASGYPEEFGYRRETYAERDRGRSPRQGSSFNEGREDRSGSGGGSFDRQFGERQFGRSSRNFEYGSRDFGPGRSQSGSNENRYDFNRGDDFERGRGGSSGFGSYGGGTGYSQSTQGREFGGERSFGFGNDTNRASQLSSHRGRGPKGYERSDERLREMICERLTDDPFIDASEVTVDVSNKVVKLTGSVEDRRIKYLIEDVIEQCGGVRDIDNQLRVQPQSQTASGQSQQTSTYGSSTTDTSLTGRTTDKSISPSIKRN